jgi:hypothetical protein
MIGIKWGFFGVDLPNMTLADQDTGVMDRLGLEWVYFSVWSRQNNLRIYRHLQEE